jgi:acetyl-CoA synthetase
VLVSGAQAIDNSAELSHANKSASGRYAMSNSTLFPVSPEYAAKAWVDEAGYKRMYEESVRDPEKFWGEHGKRIAWIKPYKKVKNTSFTGDVAI